MAYGWKESMEMDLDEADETVTVTSTQSFGRASAALTPGAAKENRRVCGCQIADPSGATIMKNVKISDIGGRREFLKRVGDKNEEPQSSEEVRSHHVGQAT